MKQEFSTTYKEINMNLLRRIPNHWRTKKLSIICQGIGSGGTPNKSDENNFLGGHIPWVLSGDLNDAVLEDCESRITQYALDKNSALKIYPAKSIIIAMYGATMGRVSLLNFPAAVNQACCVLPPSSSYASKYLFYTLIGIRPFLLSVAMGGAQVNINQNVIKSLRIPFPPLTEQKKIYKYLDKKIKSIDLLINKQSKLIELLQEKKEILIKTVICKGLNSKASMKDSKLTWIGKIPNHWELKKLSQLFKIQKGERSQRLTKEFCFNNSGKYPVYSGQTEGGGVMSYIDSFDFEAGPEGVIICTTVGAKAMSTQFITGRFNLSQNCMTISAKDNSCLMSYFQYSISSIFKLEKLKIPNHVQPSFRKEDFNHIKIPIPPINEQNEISQFLKGELTKLNKLIEISRSLISKLRSKRTAIICHATTGQQDLLNL